MKTRNKLEKEGQKGLTGLQGQKPWKNLEGKRQKFEWWSLEPTRREKEEKNYLKRTLKKSKSIFFKKADSRVSIGRKSSSIGRNRQRLPLLNLKISIGWKTEWTDRIRQRLTIFFRKNTIFEKQHDLTQSIEI